MTPSAILIEKNQHLRQQIEETMKRLGIRLEASYDAVPAGLCEQVSAARPSLLILPMKSAHAGRWRLVRELQALPAAPQLVVLAPVDTPAIRQSALAQGVHQVFDPFLELDGFLHALRQLAAAHRQLAS